MKAPTTGTSQTGKENGVIRLSISPSDYTVETAKVRDESLSGDPNQPGHRREPNNSDREDTNEEEHDEDEDHHAEEEGGGAHELKGFAGFEEAVKVGEVEGLV